MKARDDAPPLESVPAEMMRVGADLDLRRVLQAVTDTGTRLSGAQFGAFFYNAVDARGSKYVLHVVSGASASSFASMPAPQITPLVEPTFSGERTVRVDDLVEGSSRETMPQGQLPVRSYLATPVLGRDGTVIGSLLFGHADAHVFDERTENVVVAVAAQAAIAVENARLFEQEQAARLTAERAARHLSILNDVTARLVGTVAVVDAMDAVADSFAVAWQVSRMALILDGADPETVASTRLPGPGPDPQGTIVRLPLGTPSDRIGDLVVIWEDGRAVPDEDRELLESVAGQLTAAVERARLSDSEAAAREELRRHVAELTEASLTLQRSLLPAELPQIDGVTTAVRYLPAASHAEVGGDWYDVVPSSNGTVTLAIGDVQGHNMQAAAEMGRLRTTLRAYLAEGHWAAAALARTNRLTAAQHEAVLATCCLLTLDPGTGRVSMVRAGHPLPILRRANGTITELDLGAGEPLGVSTDQQWFEEPVQLDPGDRIVLYTDGLVEDRTAGSGDRVDDLLDAIRAVAGLPAESAADEILRLMHGRNQDDVALVVCDFDPAQEQLVIHDAREVAAARAYTSRQLVAWGHSEVDASATLIVSELVTNGLRHGGGAGLLLRRLANRIRIEVSDRTTDKPRLVEADADAEGERGMLLVDAMADRWGVDPGPAGGKTVWAEVTV